MALSTLCQADNQPLAHAPPTGHIASQNQPKDNGRQPHTAHAWAPAKGLNPSMLRTP